MSRLTLFDLDNTLLDGDSDYAWAQYLIDRGILDGADWIAQKSCAASSLHVPAHFAIEIAAWPRRFPAEAALANAAPNTATEVNVIPLRIQLAPLHTHTRS